jgi:hypothetical protein
MRKLTILALSAFVLSFGPVLFSHARTEGDSSNSASSWSVRLTPDGHHLELAREGKTWVKGLTISITQGSKKLNSDNPQAKLSLAPGPNKGETIVKVGGALTYDIVLGFQDSSIAVSLRGLEATTNTIAMLHAAVDGGAEPLHARLNDEQKDDVQQMVSGLATSTLNNAVYDRFRDQALRVLARETRFTSTKKGFEVTAGGPWSGGSICRFEVIDRVYSSRLPFYKPLDKKAWPHAPVGWCSWYYYFARVTEQDILKNAEAIARDYAPFGLQYCLIDAGWQIGGDGEKGSPIGGNWTEANSKFPHGMKWTADQIRADGLKPGLWLAVFGNGDQNFYDNHKDWFLHDASGNAKLGTWFGTYVADFSNPALKEYLYKAYRQHTLDWGYDYFKLDGENDTRDIWGENRNRAYDPTLDANMAYRETLGLLRQAMSSKPNVFFSACGPEYPTESMSIAQAARLGGDVVGDGEPPSFRGVRTALEAMRRGYYMHNIAWYGDPDVLVVRPPLTADEARTWTSILGLSGQLLMLSDDMTNLPDERREMLRKVIPVADITPMDLYPTDKDRHIWLLHIQRPYGQWTVAGLFNWDSDGKEIPATDLSESFHILWENDRLLGVEREWGDRIAIISNAERALGINTSYESLANKPAGLQMLPVPAYLTPPQPRHIVLDFAKDGLDPEHDYLLFDFWKQEFLGKFHGQYSVDLPGHVSEVISLRPAASHPQLVGTDRHITMGGVELQDEKWDAAQKQLHLKVSLVGNHTSTFTVYAAGSMFKTAKATAADLQASSEGQLVRVKLTSPHSGESEVILQFE